MSIGTENFLRIRLSNAFGSEPLSIAQTTLALATENRSGIPGIQLQTIQNVTFDENESTTIPAGALMVSDVINFGFSLQSQTVLSISIFIEAGHNAQCITAHPGSRTTSYFIKGNRVLEGDFNRLNVKQTDHWLVKNMFSKILPVVMGRNFCVFVCTASDCGTGITSVVSRPLRHGIREPLLSLEIALRTADVALLMATPGAWILFNQD